MKFISHIGLDIGSQSIKLVQLNQTGATSYSVVAVGQTAGVAEDAAKVEAIKKLLKETRANTRVVVISLPESQVYTRVIEMPFLTEPELTQAIRWQAEQYIPVPLNDVVLKHQILTKIDEGEEGTDAKIKVLLLAAPSLLLTNYTNLLSRAGLETIAIETEILAVARSIVGNDNYSPTTMLVHLGAESTTLSILNRGDLALTQSVVSGGAAMNRAISTTLGLDMAQAEEYKHSYGLDGTKLDGKVLNAIKPVVELILAEIKRALAFYESHTGKDPVKRFVLTGGSALLPGIVEYFTSSLNMETQVGNPFRGISLNDRQKQDIGDSGAMYATAVGLALKPT